MKQRKLPTVNAVGNSIWAESSTAIGDGDNGDSCNGSGGGDGGHGGRGDGDGCDGQTPPPDHGTAAAAEGSSRSPTALSRPPSAPC